MKAYYVWPGDEGWTDEGREIEAHNAETAAEDFAEDYFEDLDEGSDEIELNVVPVDRPHSIPVRCTVRVDVEVRRDVSTRVTRRDEKLTRI